MVLKKVHGLGKPGKSEQTRKKLYLTLFWTDLRCFVLL